MLAEWKRELPIPLRSQAGAWERAFLFFQKTKVLQKIEFMAVIFVPLFFMTACSKETPEKVETHVSTEDVKFGNVMKLETTFAGLCIIFSGQRGYVLCH
ncbi:hypothetical protein KsCSTR_12030 [Candidatus Kuenenia stuttgartiensis]|jgi:hypothetical protein|uniref:Uncharacterized protein n=1 Tax=Kuenenia stuttgartiensis TaxID=174633 RepID=Q1PYA8_KUEST|nr:hypothetical protein KsCSTR_12030 [Candidatus Kuenenia stuttgartiensis]CAJ72065.1 unknown protein [Candidatus Kuenenia stuttgartiensis]